MPKLSVKIARIEQEMIVGKSIGPNLTFDFSQSSFAIEHTRVNLTSVDYLLAGGLPIDAATDVVVACRITEKDENPDANSGRIVVPLKAEAGTKSEVLTIRVKENYGDLPENAPQRHMPVPEAEFRIFLNFIVEATAHELAEKRANEFKPELDKALDEVLSALDPQCKVDRKKIYSLLLNTANHESDCFRRVAEYHQGRGEGFIQMVPGTYNDMWDRYLKKRSTAKIAQALRKLAGGVKGTPDRGLLKTNPAFAAGMALVRYVEHKAGIKYPWPAADDITAQSEYWLEHYRERITKGKHKETEEIWKGLKKKFVEDHDLTFGKSKPKKDDGAAEPVPGAPPPQGKKRVPDRTVGL